MISWQVIVRFLSSLSIVALIGGLSTGCVIQDPPALKQLRSAGGPQGS